MPFRQAVNIFINVFQTTTIVITFRVLSSFFCAEIGVKSAAIPRICERLGIKANTNSKFLAQLVQNVARDPQFVAGGNPLARTDLEFPLAGSHFGIDSAYF
jgi:hypothetical protein